MIRTPSERSSQIRNSVRGGTGDAVFAHIWKKDAELNGNMRLFSTITLKSGDSIGYHVHEGEDELYFILSGKAEYDDNGTPHMLNPGDATLTGSGQGHSIKAAGAEDLVFLALIVSC